MKKQKRISLLAAFMSMAMSMVLCDSESSQKWQHDQTTQQAQAWQKREFLAPEECCPLVTPVCPCCDPENPGKNCFVVTGDGDDENEPTLRAAINAVNASDATECEPFSIVFHIQDILLNQRTSVHSEETIDTAQEDDVKTIVITSALPEIAKPVCINGFTQPGADEERRIIMIEIDGNRENSDGLVLQSTAVGSTIKGIAIGNFRDTRNVLIGVFASRSKIAGNNIGVRADGITPFTGPLSTATGILVDTGSDSTIGGVYPQDKNVIASLNRGVMINSSGITFAGNFVGTDVTGTELLTNRFGSLVVTGESNRIGCNCFDGRNILAGGGGFAPDCLIEGNNNRITNCFLGVDSTGTRQLSTVGTGIILRSVSNSTIKHCLIAGYPLNAVVANSSSSAKISNCFIGIDITGNCALGGDVEGAGIFFEDSENNEISSNLISYKDGAGIRLMNSSKNLIRKNYIGTNAEGTAPIGGGPQVTGIALVSMDSTQGAASLHSISSAEELEEVKETRQTELVAVGTTKNLIKLNLISGNKIAGISLQGARKNKIVHNNIGTDAWGVCCIPNGIDIQFIGEAQPNTIKCNVFCEQKLDGILVSAH